jgi:hypothetical protein
MKLPNGERAVVDIRKLRNYCLDPSSPKGRTKARLFAAALGVTERDAQFLRNALLTAAKAEMCEPREQDEYGRRYSIDFRLRTNTGEGVVRSGWIVLHDEDFPRLTTCFVVKSKVRS